jgi:phosphohistidine phosphatase
VTKTILLLRHGKSDWNSSLENDYDRPLALRGKQAARRMATLITEEELEPELILTSPAARAAQTAQIVQFEIGDVDLAERESLYEAEVEDLLSAVQALPNDLERVMLVGHNPGLEELAAELTGDSGIVLKTCTLVVINARAGDWRDISPGSAKLAAIYNPRDIED